MVGMDLTLLPGSGALGRARWRSTPSCTWARTGSCVCARPGSSGSLATRCGPRAPGPRPPPPPWRSLRGHWRQEQHPSPTTPPASPSTASRPLAVRSWRRWAPACGPRTWGSPWSTCTRSACTWTSPRLPKPWPPTKGTLGPVFLMCSWPRTSTRSCISNLPGVLAHKRSLTRLRPWRVSPRPLWMSSPPCFWVPWVARSAPARPLPWALTPAGACPSTSGRRWQAPWQTPPWPLRSSSSTSAPAPSRSPPRTRSAPACRRSLAEGGRGSSSQGHHLSGTGGNDMVLVQGLQGSIHEWRCCCC
mmetsp:Transcript_24808/g.38339  ORF Transcript_24808/g.38339 Transcript_24808/m.38339 type:complete len:303 (+) Transcript_24808:313-1221(+)